MKVLGRKENPPKRDQHAAGRVHQLEALRRTLPFLPPLRRKAKVDRVHLGRLPLEHQRVRLVLVARVDGREDDAVRAVAKPAMLVDKDKRVLAPRRRYVVEQPGQVLELKVVLELNRKGLGGVCGAFRVSRGENTPVRLHQPGGERVPRDQFACDDARVVDQVAHLAPSGFEVRVDDELSVEQRARPRARKAHWQLAHSKVAVHHERAPVAKNQQHVAHAVGLLGDEVVLLFHLVQVPALKRHGLRPREPDVLQAQHVRALSPQALELEARHFGQGVQHERVHGSKRRAPPRLGDRALCLYVFKPVRAQQAQCRGAQMQNDRRPS